VEIEIREFLDPGGRSPFGQWFESLNAVAAAKVAIALTRLSQGNFSNVKGVGAGVYEIKLDFGPGYRVYFGKDGERIVILLGGSAKKRQEAAIAAAIGTWAEYKRRKGRQGVRYVALTRAFRETVYRRAQRDRAFRKALLTEAVNAYLSGDEAAGKAALRDVINATIGFEQLAADLEKPSKSLHRMLGPSGNPSTANFFAILQVLQKRAGTRLTVKAA
jgi:putative addiction module killer protein